MKKYSAVLMILVFAGLFLTSCEKEALLPTPGNTNTTTPTLKAGEGGEDGDGIDDDDLGGGDSEEGITDGGRDEDYDKTSKKKPKS